MKKSELRQLIKEELALFNQPINKMAVKKPLKHLGLKEERMNFNNHSPEYMEAYGDGYIDGYRDGQEGNEMAVEKSLNEMAKIAGDLQSSIEKVIQSNPDLENLPLKKAIKADASVQAALGDQTLYDNQLNKFIALTKGERQVGQRGRKADPNKPAKTTTGTGRRGRPKSPKKDPALSTSKLGGRKYYTKKGDDGDGPSDAELRKLAKSGGNVGRSKDAQLKQQTKTKLVKSFLQDMKSKGIVDTSNKILDKEKYDAEWAQAKPEIMSQVKAVK